jgi:hypothetical protein
VCVCGCLAHRGEIGASRTSLRVCATAQCLAQHQRNVVCVASCNTTLVLCFHDNTRLSHAVMATCASGAHARKHTRWFVRSIDRSLTCSRLRVKVVTGSDSLDLTGESMICPHHSDTCSRSHTGVLADGRARPAQLLSTTPASELTSVCTKTRRLSHVSARSDAENSE